MITFIALTILYVVIIIFHSVGLYLLVSLHKDGRSDIQLILIMNLSVTEILLSIFNMLEKFLEEESLNNSETFDVAAKYLSIVLMTPFEFSHYMNMLYITINKLLEVLLNIKYELYCTFSKVKYLIGVTWLVGIVFCASIILVEIFAGYELESLIIYSLVAFDFAFIVIAVGSNSYIFHKYRKSCIAPVQTTPQPSIWNVFRNSRFYVSALMILSFLLLVVTPDVINILVPRNVEDDVEDEDIVDIYVNAVDIVLDFMINLSYLSNALIYIFMHTPVKQLLLRKLQATRCLNTIEANE